MMSKYHHPLKNKNTDETIYIAIAIVISYGLFFCFQILYVNIFLYRLTKLYFKEL